MIIFNLKCDSDHQFEGWFKNKDEFDRQIKCNMLTCPQCGCENIIKIPTASRINTLSSKATSTERLNSSTRSQEGNLISEQFVEKLSNYVEENFTYVGQNFPEEARKIYYGESESKNIYGHATNNEIKSLNEEGVSIVSLPVKAIKKDKLN
ncbi:DUF1178 family protein [Beggiatoa alba]|nr:DUF1178 family protein [Beggiatoa alba]